MNCCRRLDFRRRFRLEGISDANFDSFEDGSDRFHCELARLGVK